ncbi:Tryptophanase [Metarhizium brunneum]|uniref:Tryptophanase n=1 Tax=Metarhizium brunneum TaxID=500148 RepID=A0A7D5UXJ2_9HYPO
MAAHSNNLPPVPVHRTLVVRTAVQSTAQEREHILKEVEYNVFAFPAEMVYCDFLSDSGTSAMTDVQWAALLRGDESYGRNAGYYCLQDAFRDIFERGHDRRYLFRHVMAGTVDSQLYCNTLLQPSQGGFVNGGHVQLARPNFYIVPQGGCAEAILFSELMNSSSSNDASVAPVIISNGFFDTTATNAAAAGFELATFLQPGLREPLDPNEASSHNPFKGNLDLLATRNFLAKNHHRTALILITITNNFATAQPVSMANIRAAASLAKGFNIPCFFDACRFAENARLIQEFEPGYDACSIAEIVKEMFSLVDGFTISLKKDGMSNMGGALAIRDNGCLMKKSQDIGVRLKERQILAYGNDSYGGMRGHDLMAAAAGLYETTKESYLRSSIGQVRSFAQKLHSAGVPILWPPGGHAIYLDMNAFFADCPRSPGDFASVGFTIELLRQHGIRAVEAGPFAWEWDKKQSEEERDAIPDLVRFAVPRNSMNDGHIDYTVAAIHELYQQRHILPNVRIIRGKHLRIRHFQCGFALVPASRSNGSQSATNNTFFSAAEAQIRALGRSLSFNDDLVEVLVREMQLAMGAWGESAVSKSTNGHISHVGNDHAPIEYSISFDVNTGTPQLRFLIEAQPPEDVAKVKLADLQLAALELNRTLRQRQDDALSFTRFDMIKDLFIPETNDAQNVSGFAAWHSACVSPGSKRADWKIYLNPDAQGASQRERLIRASLTRLGFEQVSERLSLAMGPTDRFCYFSLDLDKGWDARIKIYIEHPNATAQSVANMIQKVCLHLKADNRDEIVAFVRAMSGNTSGPLQRKSVVTCFAFTTDRTEPSATVHFPVSDYARNDAEIHCRVVEYCSNKAPMVLPHYVRSIVALRQRSLSDGKGLHSWVSLKQSPGGSLGLTFYLSAELFGPLPDLEQ